MLWVVIALLTLVAVLCVVWPLSKPRGAVAMPLAGDDLSFYRDQWASLDRDVAEGLVSPAEAAASRAEVGRRLLAAAAPRVGAAPQKASRPLLFTVAVVVTLALPAASLLLYGRIGAPDLRDRPLAARLATPDPDDMPAAIARIEAHLAAHPEDGRGFALLAPIYLRLGRYADAAHAYERKLAVLGEAAPDRVSLGEALMAGGATIPPAAEAAFAKARDDDPHLPQPRFYLGLAAAQAGDTAGAEDLWSGLLAEAPPEAPWVPMVQDRLAALRNQSDRPGGPQASAIAALPAADRQQAIVGMVDGLAARLKVDGRDAEGWLKLLRAYVVLGDAAKAQGALAEARHGLAADPGGLGRVEGLAHELGLEPQG
ncbi:c-type cytochrome biogenesis protein CcmI [Lichenihabitans sp. Uapishka_5]|uniref:c-type cytochrome biogenesis protein CcmI n=1 Tax=Lichenihabitans sp. Uapishka_5 TaxID=3037302 RepID=UPI0029E7F7F3|nr:c-type cytochrome biogenesis protein CcmI [Lichenihabitans sp. Uapishka_5]MDX7953694.1 c-type cytochrome biogenesis protein CcmI [Lichenihabitans sp. Uapishka_5]